VMGAALLATPAFAAKIQVDDNTSIDVRYLMQVKYEDPSNGPGDFFIRRSRIILSGNINETVSFFMETDDYNQGKGANGAATGSGGKGIFTQDAYVDLKLPGGLNLAAGYILLPFSHHNRQSAASLLGVDYNLDLVKMPNTNVWRDTGVELRGLLADNMVDFRVGVFDGGQVDSTGSALTTSSNSKRITGRVQINLRDAETGFFYSNNYLGKKEVLSFGVGIDTQKDAATFGKTYTATTFDAVLDMPLGENVLSGQAAYYTYKNNGTNSGKGYFVQAGYKVGDLQPVVKIESFDFDTGTDFSTVRAGVNYLIDGHGANVKVEYASKKPSGGSAVNTVSAQLQILL